MASNSYRVTNGLVCVGAGTIYGVGDGSSIHHAVSLYTCMQVI